MWIHTLAAPCTILLAGIVSLGAPRSVQGQLDFPVEKAPVRNFKAKKSLDLFDFGSILKGLGNSCREDICIEGNLECAASFDGELTQGDCRLIQDGTFFDIWAFELTESQLVEIRLSSVQMDGFVILVDSDCVLLGSNDDCPGGGTNSCLAFFLGPGRYFVGANSFAPEQGAYTVELSCSPVDSCRDCTPRPVTCNKAVSNRYPENVCPLLGDVGIELWKLDLIRASTLSVTLNSTEIDPFLYVLDSECNPVAMNDDCTPGNTSTSCLEVAAEAGTVYIGVKSFSPGETGDYDLIVTCQETPVADFRRGDVDASGVLDVSDPISNLLFQFVGDVRPSCIDALDFDDSGELDITDPIASLTHQFLGGPPPAAPGKDACGADPTVDELTCESFAACPGNG